MNSVAEQLENFESGFGNGNAEQLGDLMKALDTGNYGQLNGPAGQVNGAALQVESLDASLRAVTFKEDHIKFWKKIPMSEANATVEEYNQLLSYGGDGDDGFMLDGGLPEEQDSDYRRMATKIKFLGTTRRVTHAATLTRTSPQDVIGLENQNGIKWLLERAEHGIFWGDSELAAVGKEGQQFDGLNKLIPDENIVDACGKQMTPEHIEEGATIITENYGHVTDMFLPVNVMKDFRTQYFPMQRIVMPTEGYLQGGVIMNKYQTDAGNMEFNPDLFLQKTKPLNPAKLGGLKAPTMPGKVTIEAGTETDAEFAKSGKGTYAYSVTACSGRGESMPTEADAEIAITEEDFAKGVKITIENAANMTVAPEWFNVYRTEADGKQKFLIMRVRAQSTTAGGVSTGVDKNKTMANTYTAFMGELTPEVIQFKRLAPIMKMDLARIDASYRWMILMYGAPILYIPGRWVKITNIAGGAHTPENGLYR